MTQFRVRTFGTIARMRSAARVTQLIHDEIERQAAKHIPIAEVCRRVRRVAEHHNLTPPSYERVRTLVHRARRLRSQSTASVILEIACRTEAPDALVEHLSGARPRKR